MKILVTGGTGVIGAGSIPELLKLGHEVRLLSRGAERDAKEYPERVEPFAADISDETSLRGAAEGCEVVVHITGIVDEKPPEITFQRINVEGTGRMLREAERAGVRRFIYMSSLGADRGESDYHQSKLAAEKLVESSSLEWMILRPGNVYGPGDEVISTLLKMIRVLPAVPVVGHGDQLFQPIWFEDLGRAVARACEEIPARRIYELAGLDVTTTREVMARLCELTGRNPTQIALPTWLAQLGTSMMESFGGFGKRLASESGVPLPINSAKLEMLVEGNVAQEGRNALESVFGVQATGLADGLNALADRLPELLPEEGVGPLRRKLFWADIEGSRLSPEQMIALFGERITEIMPIEFAAEPGAPTASRAGETLTGAIPARGNIQVRVEEQTERSLTLVTVQGHPLAGTVTFRAERAGALVRFAVEVHARAANILDYIALRTLGGALQRQNWREVVKRVVEISGGKSVAGVQNTEEELSGDEERDAEAQARRLVRERKKQEHREELATA